MSETAQKLMEVEEVDGVTVVTLLVKNIRKSGEEIGAIHQELVQIVKAGKYCLIIDWREVAQAPADIFQTYLTIQRMVDARDGLLIMCGFCPFLQDLLTRTQLKTAFVTTIDRDAALELFWQVPTQ